jgi:hypothetical protein
MVGRTGRINGWKLHVSTIPSNAHRLLAVVVPILKAAVIPFKIARNVSMLQALSEGSFGATQVGKFATIYPPDDSSCRALADTLIAVTMEFVGPRIISDLYLGSVIYARYGSFNPVSQRDRLGQYEARIQLPNGEMVPDRYTVPLEVPPEVSNPFADLVPLPIPVEDASSTEVEIFGPGYVLVDNLHPAAKGSVFLAIDLVQEDQRRLVVLKEGRKYCATDGSDVDARDRLKREAGLLESLKERVRVPFPGQYFEVAENGYLPLEFIDGSHLGTRYSAYAFTGCTT